MEQALKKYWKEKKPTSNCDILVVTLLAPGQSTNHLNYKVATTKGTYVARVSNPKEVLPHGDLADEFAILKLAERYNVGPRAICIDSKHFDFTLLVEEYLDGVPYSELSEADAKEFQGAIELLLKVSSMEISKERFPHKSTYLTYVTNFTVWHERLLEISRAVGEESALVRQFGQIAKEAENILQKKEHLLAGAPKEFIYNDVHPGNMFWMPLDHSAKFIDWQKVSLGDPTFMAALFARRFGSIWREDNAQFATRVMKACVDKKQVPNFNELFHARLLERAVSDMIWVVWADVKRGNEANVSPAEANPYYLEAKSLMSTFSM